jgi:hypothetical protein
MAAPAIPWLIGAAAGGALRIPEVRTTVGRFALGAASTTLPPAIRELSFESSQRPTPPPLEPTPPAFDDRIMR